MHGRVLSVLTAVTWLTALLTGHPLILRLAWTLSLALGIAAAITWYSVRWVDLGRRTRSARAEVGGTAEERFTLTNRGWLPKLWLEVHDRGDLPGHRASRVLTGIMPGRSRSWTARTICRRRGLFRLGPVTLSGGDPLGVFKAEREFPQTASFVVYPRSFSLRGLDLPSGYLSGGQVVRRRSDFATTNVRSVRQYRPGDALSRIHWPTTARRGQLHSREFELDPISDFWILLDMDRRVHAGSLAEDEEDEGLAWLDDKPIEIDPTTEEYAITAAASLARHFLETGKNVGLIAHAQRRVIVQPDRGERQIGKILSHLAVLKAAGRAGLSEVMSAENHEFTRHTTLVVVTPTAALRWVEALRELRERGVGSFVALIEASTFGTAASSEGLIHALDAHHVPRRLIRCGDHIGAALEG